MLVLSVAGSFFGRLASGVLAHYIGAIVTWLLCAFASGVMALSWISIEKESTFIAFSILWGTCLDFHACRGLFSKSGKSKTPNLEFWCAREDVRIKRYHVGLNFVVSNC